MGAFAVRADSTTPKVTTDNSVYLLPIFLGFMGFCVVLYLAVELKDYLFPPDPETASRREREADAFLSQWC